MVIKYGGNAMTDDATRQRAAAALYDATLGGEPPVVVHGGGPFIQAALDAAGLEHRFERGLRGTTPESLQVIESVLTLLGKKLAQEIGPAVGLTGRDAALLHAAQRPELGRVGRMTRVEPHVLTALRAAGLVPVVAFFLFKTKQGLRLQACGEHPQAAVSAGIDINLYRYGAVLASGALAGLGGAYLSIGNLNYFTLEMTNGRGFIALAAVILGGWTPWGALAAALLFGAAEGIQVQGQSTPGFPISSDLLVALPYIVTLIAITLFVKARSGPAGLGEHATTS